MVKRKAAITFDRVFVKALHADGFKAFSVVALDDRLGRLGMIGEDELLAVPLEAGLVVATFTPF